MSGALFKATLKGNYKMFLVIFSIMLMYATIIISMYNPDNMDAWDAMLELFPEELLRAMNFNIFSPTFLGYVAGYYYGFIMIVFPIIYIGIMGNRALIKYVDQGSMSFLLASPNTRTKIALTQAIYLYVSTVVLILTIALVTALMGVVMFPGDLEWLEFLMLNLNMIGLATLLSSIVFLAGCVFNESKQAIGTGMGIIVFFFVVNMLANANDDLSFFRFMTVFTLFDAERILDLNPIIYIQTLVLLLSGLGLYALGIAVFTKKDLHI